MDKERQDALGREVKLRDSIETQLIKLKEERNNLMRCENMTELRIKQCEALTAQIHVLTVLLNTTY